MPPSPSRPPLWAAAVLAGGGVVAVGALRPAVALTTASRVAPILGFLVALTVVAELCDTAGLFDQAADLAARLAGGRTAVLFALVVVLATATTATLSLDTTAVLLTPVVLSLCARLGLAPLPFAMATVWLANTASLFLPVSNLTNLLALQRLDVAPAQYAARMLPAAVTAVLLTVGVLVARHHRSLRGRYRVPPRRAVADRVLLGTALLVVLGFAAGVLAGVDVTAVAAGGAVVLVVACALRRPRALSWGLLPWRLVLTVVGLFLLVATADQHGLTGLAGSVAGTGGSPADLVRLSLTSALGANLVNNLPAYLALEPVADGSATRLLAVLVGVGTGPLVLVWGSLATLLWRERCRAAGLTIGAGELARAGSVLVPVVVVGTTLALALSS